MKEKLKDDKFVKDLLYKFLSLLIIAIVALLLLNVMTQNKDGRTQIIDEDGGTEYWETTASTLEERKLERILSSIKGVGDVSVMLTYEDTGSSNDIFSNEGAKSGGEVKGAIITAAGGADAVAKRNILEAVTALFNIPVQNVKVYEKIEEGNK
ncbi:MAG: hypothetical protein GXX92_11040 [Clostridiales bacterium]|nr:hypothetical protein [Clostridiales bacterium]